MSMRYRTAVDFRAALETRLRAESAGSGRSVQRLRRMVAFDRLLARLLVVAPDRWVLKGGLALDFRLGARTRFTRDMDLARMDDADAATEDMIAAQACDVGDFFAFAVQRTDRLDALVDGAAVRYHLSAQLAGRVFEETVADVGLSGPFTWTPQSLRCPALLSFAGIAPLDVPVLPLEQHVAEKLHAYTRGYGDGTVSSTRVKDLLDLVLIADLARFDARTLRAALTSVFAVRGRQALPTSVPLPPPGWRDPYARLAETVGLDHDVLAGHAYASAFLTPVLATDDLDALWDNALRRWIRSGNVT